MALAVLGRATIMLPRVTAEVQTKAHGGLERGHVLTALLVVWCRHGRARVLSFSPRLLALRSLTSLLDRILLGIDSTVLNSCRELRLTRARRQDDHVSVNH